MSRLRSDLASMEGYHSPQVSVEVRLNTNESPIALPDEYVGQLAEAIRTIAFNRYPDRSAVELQRAIAALEGVAPNQVYAANGSNEVIENLLLAFGGADRSAMVFEPSYALHAHLVRTTATELITIERDRDLSLDASLVGQSVAEHDPDIIFLCSPNNPTGEVLAHDVVDAALENGTGLIIVDEAYIQFADPGSSALVRSESSDRVVILRTFSKTWSLAGVRLGFCIASPEVIRGLEIVTLPYHLSSLTQMAGLLALKYLDDMEQRIAIITSERDRIAAELENQGFKVWPSSANFILFRPADGQGHKLWSHLVDHSILVRDCSSWPRLSGCLRVTVGTPHENDRFLHSIKEAQ